MTEFQLDTFTRVNSIEKELEKVVDPSVFVLNPRVMKLLNQLDDLRNHCDHKFTNGKCEICGKLEETK